MAEARKFPPTAQQQAIIDAALTGDHMIVEAGPGSGKTQTLFMVATAMREHRSATKGKYLAFNKSTQLEAAKMFPRTFEPRTGHSLAYAVHGRRMAHKLPGKRDAQRLSEVAGIIGATSVDLTVTGGRPVVVAPEKIAHAAKVTCERFARSADDEITPRHLAKDALPEGADRAAYSAAVLDAARRMWVDLASPNGALRMPHDVYRKLWALDRPQLGVDVVMLDEGQDTPPVLEKVVRDQACQQIIVGDPCQQLYEWAGAVDALSNFAQAGTRVLRLGKAWRFGEPIADEVNKWLTALGRDPYIEGNPDLDSVLVDDLGDRADAVLCRTNVGAISEVIAAQDAGRAVALVGGTDEIEKAARAARDLMSGRGTNHPEFSIFTSWDEVRAAVQADTADSSLKTFVHMVERFGPAGILSAAAQVVRREDAADVIVSTGHKAKGREWNAVRVCSDFAPKDEEPAQDGETAASGIPEPKTPGTPKLSRPAAFLAYTTVSRARRVLDRGPLSYVDALIGNLMEETSTP